MWTKEEIRTVRDLFETTTMREIAAKIGREDTEIGYIISLMRNAGFKIPKKSSKGYMKTLLGEVLEEKPARRRFL